MGRAIGFLFISLGLVGLGLTLVDWSALQKEWGSRSTEQIAAAEEESTSPDSERKAKELAPANSPPASSSPASSSKESDAPSEQDEPTIVTELDSGNVKIFDRADQSATDSLPWVDIAPSDDSVSEDSDHVSFLLTLSEPVERPIIIIFSTVDGSARSDEDYLGQRGTVTFKPGIVSAEIRTPLIDDQVEEDDEQFAMVLNGAPGIVNLKNRRAKATIKDND